MTPMKRPTDTALSGLPYVSLLGCLAGAANVVLSFEEPHRGMLLLAGILVVSAPLGLAIHLALTTELTRADKRLWATALTSPASLRFFATYFTSSERGHTTQLLRHEGIESATKAMERRAVEQLDAPDERRGPATDAARR
jgi:hypothetical protein